jgi:hypothetical protein
MIKYFFPVILLCGSLQAVTLDEQGPSVEETVEFSPQTMTTQQQSWPLWLAYRLRFGALALELGRDLAYFGRYTHKYMTGTISLFTQPRTPGLFDGYAGIIAPFTYQASMAGLAWYCYPRQQPQLNTYDHHTLKTTNAFVLSFTCAMWGLYSLATAPKSIPSFFSGTSKYFNDQLSSQDFIKILLARYHRHLFHGIAALSHAYILYAEAQPVKDTQSKPETIA